MVTQTTTNNPPKSHRQVEPFLLLVIENVRQNGVGNAAELCLHIFPQLNQLQESSRRTTLAEESKIELEFLRKQTSFEREEPPVLSMLISILLCSSRKIVVVAYVVLVTHHLHHYCCKMIKALLSIFLNLVRACLELPPYEAFMQTPRRHSGLPEGEPTSAQEAHLPPNTK